MMNKLLKLTLVVTTLMLPIHASLAGTVTIPNTFVSGTPAVASQVNDNFSAVATAVNDNANKIDSLQTQTAATPPAITDDAPSSYTNTDPNLTINFTVQDDKEVAYFMVQQGTMTKTVLVAPGQNAPNIAMPVILSSGNNSFIAAASDMDGSITKVAFNIDYEPVISSTSTCLDGSTNTTRAIVPPPIGDLVITEVMPNPISTTPGKEWFEITNVGSTAFDLAGLGLDVAGDSYPPYVINGYCHSLAPYSFVFFRQTAPLDSYYAALNNAIAQYGNMVLANNYGNVQVVDPTTCDTASPYTCATVYDKVTWQTSTTGSSMQLKDGYFTTTDNDIEANFCTGSLSVIDTDGDTGTPGYPNDCP